MFTEKSEPFLREIKKDHVMDAPCSRTLICNVLKMMVFLIQLYIQCNSNQYSETFSFFL